MKKLLMLAALLVCGSAQAITVAVRCEGPAATRQTVVNFTYDTILSFEKDGFGSTKKLTSLTATGAYGDFNMNDAKYGSPTLKVSLTDSSAEIVHLEMFPYGHSMMPYEDRNVDVTLSECFKKGTDKGTLTERPYRNGQVIESLSCTCTGDWL